MYCNEYGTDWKTRLSMVQLYYNSTPQSRTGYSPHYVMTGRDMKLPIDIALETVRNSDIPASASFAEELVTLWNSVKAKLEKD